MGWDASFNNPGPTACRVLDGGDRQTIQRKRNQASKEDVHGIASIDYWYPPIPPLCSYVLTRSKRCRRTRLLEIASQSQFLSITAWIYALIECDQISPIRVSIEPGRGALAWGVNQPPPLLGYVPLADAWAMRSTFDGRRASIPSPKHHLPPHQPGRSDGPKGTGTSWSRVPTQIGGHSADPRLAFDPISIVSIQCTCPITAGGLPPSSARGVSGGERLLINRCEAARRRRQGRLSDTKGKGQQ